ncbi:double-strand break repair helicase AddA [Aquamicrobium segne]|uniref:DNA 3'-5' helicase n=1 Tax=Aquamicrobium segne TaxID=469547 RepID=A0ABW0GWY7_9HYPH
MKYPIPTDTALAQARASDPANSAWVSANAGSGKTHVLAQRVIRLLLRGTEPSKILCLTYTRAAAANMSNRIFATLSEWTVLDEATLAEHIEKMEGAAPDLKTLQRARRLFAEALETPGGLKIQTIHAFCEAVLHQFPLEANIVAHFQMLDSQMEQALVAAARRDMIAGTVGGASHELTDAFATVLERGGESGLDALLAEIVSKRNGLREFLTQIGGTATHFEPLFEEFGFDIHDSEADIASALWPLPEFDPAYLTRLDQLSLQLGANRARSSLMEEALAAFAQQEPILRLAQLHSSFLSGKGEAYKPDWLFSKALIAAMPDLPERYLATTEKIIAACDRLALYRMVKCTLAALTIADWLIQRYEELKRARGLLDFNDLITRTVNLLKRPDAGAWVQYKLDQGIDHILLDEAQDTSPEQWDVVKKLAEEFFTGESARDNVLRTIFAVGDEKQSIYSFQGAAPDSFIESKKAFSHQAQTASREFADLKLTFSFRSSEDVLRAVDHVFTDPQVRRGISHDPDPLDHKAIRNDAPGYVEIWPSLGADQVEEPDDWTQPVNHASAPAVRVAEHVATTIKNWLDSGEILEGKGRTLRAGDILVLVRKRDRFIHALSKSLKEKGVPVAGADRLSLPGHIAVKDLAALGRFLVQPQDDLSLAAVLRSPIFDLSEEQLFTLAAGREPGQSLIQSLHYHAKTDPQLAKNAQKLEHWASEAAFKPVFEFYAALLARDGVRRNMIARLGPEAGDILDEFLNFCLAQERTGLPGLDSFLSTLENTGPEVKREMDQTRNEVRIMTVHASKGLEAPVVFLIDSGARAFSDQHLPRLMPFESSGQHWNGRGYLWRSDAEIANSISRKAAEKARDLADDEYRRLLYVAMTRAEDRLIVAGYHGKRDPGDATWHSIVSRALISVPETREVAHPANGETVHRFHASGLAPLKEKQTDKKLAPDNFTSLPQQLFEKLDEDEELPRPLSPSGASVLIDEDVVEPVADLRSPVLDTKEEPSQAILRGNVTHKLLQMLPDIPLENRLRAAQRYLERAGAHWSESERERLLFSVMSVLENPHFAPVFATGSRAEIALMGHLKIKGRNRALSGKIDRLAVSAHKVLIIDYKTNLTPPATLAQVPQAYILQLALYRELLKPLYPEREIAAALLFTQTPHLMELTQDMMDAALARLALS